VNRPVRVAAVGDVHYNSGTRDRLRPHLEGLGERADVLLLAGDLTCLGTTAEAEAVAADLEGAEVPVFAVLGNHDYQSDEEVAVAAALGRAGVRVLEGDSACVDVGGTRIGIAGAKGFGGGFAGASGSDFGEPEMKAFMRHTMRVAGRLRDSLLSLAADVRIALLHYSPVPDTLDGERLEIYPFLGSHLLGDALDEAGADLVLHGHAHGGTEEGVTSGGVPVRNVAQPVLGRPLAIYAVGGGEEVCRLA
jgi:Icc-related predicted phosphoesterase